MGNEPEVTSLHSTGVPIPVYHGRVGRVDPRRCGLVIRTVELMNSSWVRLVLVTGLAFSVQAQTTPNPPSTNTISPPRAPLIRPPSPPDAPLPDLDSLPSPADTTKSKVKRALDRLTPNCADVVYHSCWSSPAPDPSASLPEAEREAQRNREAGEIYYENKNYRGGIALSRGLALPTSRSRSNFRAGRVAREAWQKS